MASPRGRLGAGRRLGELRVLRRRPGAYRELPTSAGTDVQRAHRGVQAHWAWSRSRENALDINTAFGWRAPRGRRMQGGVGAQPHLPWDHCGHVGYLWTGYVVQNGCSDSKVGAVEGGIAGALARHAMPRRAGCEESMDLSPLVCTDMEYNKGTANMLRFVVCVCVCSDWSSLVS